MLDLSKIDDNDVKHKLETELKTAEPLSDRWRIIGTSLNALEVESFSKTKTYPRPDHPNPKRRRPVEFLLIGVLVSLRTTLENEQLAMDRLLDRCLTISDVLTLDEKELTEIIRPAGMAQQKSQRILACLREIQKLDGGLASLEQKSKTEARNYLLSLPGIGPKAADCVMTIGLGFSSMVVDVNVFRMASYLFGIEIKSTYKFTSTTSVNYIKQRLDEAIGEDAFLCQIIHTMLLLAGRRVGKEHSSERCLGKKYCISCHERTALRHPILFETIPHTKHRLRQ
ncbi:MAG: endonuclease III domain-containing protein [Candidatus Nanosyncoccaceae bacterium]|jgi:endonuclease III